MDNFDQNINVATQIPTGAPVIPQVGAQQQEQAMQDSASLPNAVPQQNKHLAILQRVNAIKAELKTYYVERERVIDDMILALVSRQHMVMLGAPGTAKSALIEALTAHITGANCFKWLLNKTTDPSELLGSFSIKQMENDRFMRIATGKLPEAHTAFIDEIFKSNGPVLNTLLSILNERVFFNDGKPIPVPLLSMFSASNEPPEDESLDALYDRILFRHEVGYIQSPTNKISMFKGMLAKRANGGIVSQNVITLDELNYLYELSKEAKVPSTVLTTFNKLIQTLTTQSSITVSDRRQNECIKIMQANAVLCGRNSVARDDLEAIVYTLWKDARDIDIITSEIAKVANPAKTSLSSMKKTLKDALNKFNTNVDEQEPQRAIQLQLVIAPVEKEIRKLAEENSKMGDTSMDSDVSEISGLLNQAREIVGKSLMFGIPGVGGGGSPFVTPAAPSPSYDADPATTSGPLSF